MIGTSSFREPMVFSRTNENLPAGDIALKSKWNRHLRSSGVARSCPGRAAATIAGVRFRPILHARRL
ncbi:hypothetical protein FTUN_2278 [Frigoriglobus tundricola]|uniref:Uncharacterized protein n=1 Tax=Frigoriglobus tundricola TaxID=2774151 RepID=A0A6M5YLG0_9BACT|nr:hypothetical protein FTUN_2278 [Frigoriglobus tundricola]